MKKLLKAFINDYPQLLLVIGSVILGGVLDLRGIDHVAHLLLGATALIMTLPLLWDMYQTLRDGELGIDLLAATAIIASVLLHEYWAAIVIVLMLTGGEALEDYSENRAKAELTTLISNVPRIAHIVRGRNVVDIKVSEINPGQTLEIRPGEMVPVDCEVVDGQSSFDESSLTGESLPVEHGAGEAVMSGSINGDTVVRVKATASSENSQYEQIIRLVRDASQSKAHFVRLADRYSVPFTVISFAIAGGVWIATGQALRFLEVIVVATPCPLLLAAPIAIISGMSRSAKAGIIVKNGTALERLASARSIAFDKTGTLTRGELAVDKIVSLDDKYDEAEVLRLAATLERSSNHVLALAITKAASERGLKLKKATDISETPGLGLRGQLAHQQILVGKGSLLTENGVKLPKSKQIQQTAVYVAVGSKVIGAVTFADEVREESKSTIARLHKLGLKFAIMITGDNHATASAIAKQVGIKEFYADSLPADKLRIVKQVDAKHKPIAFVGDGVNDAPVLAAADVGIAIGARGNTAASESADVVIMLDDLGKVADGVAIARRSIRIGLQSILVGIFISIGLMLVFATGRFKPVYGAALQEVVDVIVILNALRAHHG